MESLCSSRISISAKELTLALTFLLPFVAAVLLNGAFELAALTLSCSLTSFLLVGIRHAGESFMVPVRTAGL